MSKCEDRNLNQQVALVEVVKLIEGKGKLTGKQIGEYLRDKHQLGWSKASVIRNGSGIKQWVDWLYQGKLTSSIPPVNAASKLPLFPD